MTESSTLAAEPRLPSLPLVREHVARQFGRRGDLADAQFFYAEIANRMRERLEYIRLAPSAVLDAGCGTAPALAPLLARYPQARYVGLDQCAPLLALAARRHAPAPADRLRRAARRLSGRAMPPAPAFVLADLAATGLPPESIDLVWSNLALHWHPQPHAVLAEWRRVLRVGGLAMFSCLGPGTFRELREAVGAAGLRTATPPFVDMHDFGDLLVENGFADPVMDQETITLTYREPARLLHDVRSLGGNPAAGRRRGLAGRAWRDRLQAALNDMRDAEGLIRLTMEVAYGHAWRAASHRAGPGETRLSASAIGRARPR
ncbi:methyltransferase domain-containing protein [Pigmentiphaga soli]|uniref:Malonyl-[acyl-carrier protein] O-methyltransferase n=1 Tax=Pigmentiphaga soli TaxID=1007095 RepID=A0ABP8GI40_9BURK